MSDIKLYVPGLFTAPSTTIVHVSGARYVAAVAAAATVL